MTQSLSYTLTHKSCINNSSSKQLFSFSKDSRFKYKTQSITSKISFGKFSQYSQKKGGYAFPKTRKKLIFHHQTQRSSTPSPNLYSCKSELQIKKLKRSGFSIGAKLRSLMIKQQDFPQPSRYSKTINSMKKQRQKTFSKAIRKLEFPKKNQIGKDSPGPVYTIQMQKLKQLVGKYKNPMRTKIVKVSNPEELVQNLKNRQINGKRKRQKSLLQSIQINEQKLLKYRGRIVKFGNQKRKTIFDKKTDNPGPGRYLTFSEFAKKEKPIQVQKLIQKKNKKKTTLE